MPACNNVKPKEFLHVYVFTDSYSTIALYIHRVQGWSLLHWASTWLDSSFPADAYLSSKQKWWGSLNLTASDIQTVK